MPDTGASRPPPSLLKLLLVLPPALLAAAVLYEPENFSPASVRGKVGTGPSPPVPEIHGRILATSERIGEGLLYGPEDLAHDSVNGLIYTGCGDGWIRRVELAGLKVEDWAHVGGRPLGLVLQADGSLIVADAYKGLLKVNPDKTVELLTDEAEGLKFRLTDGVDVASDGVIFFTDASYKYELHDCNLDFLEARPHGRLMSFDPSTKRTTVLARDLHFANGVSLAPDQASLVFCETTLRKCSRYHIRGEKNGTLENFVDNLPGMPDNIRYDGEDRYWIALFAGRTKLWDVMLEYPILRKLVYLASRVVEIPEKHRNSGVMSVTLDGEPVSLHIDPDLSSVTGGVKIGGHLYYGSLHKSYISRVELGEFAASGK